VTSIGDLQYWKATIRFSTSRFLGGTDTSSFTYASEVAREPFPASGVEVDPVDVTGPATQEEWEAWQVARQRGEPPEPEGDPVPDHYEYSDDGDEGWIVWVAHGSTDIVVALPPGRDPALLDPDDVEDAFPTAYLPEDFDGEAEPHPGM
jgi:hypothetical protein